MFSYSVLREDEESESESEEEEFHEEVTNEQSEEIHETKDPEEEKDIVYTAPYKKINEQMYCMRGNETIQRHSERLVVYNNSKVALFWGKCFLCAYIGHSQRYCPLKYCSKCSSYGHSVVTCANSSAGRKQLNFRTTAEGRIHPSLTSINWRSEKKRKKHHRPDKHSSNTQIQKLHNKPRKNDAATFHSASAHDECRGESPRSETKKHAPCPSTSPGEAPGGADSEKS